MGDATKKPTDKSFEAAKSKRTKIKKHERRDFVADEIRIEEKEGEPKKLVGYAAKFNKIADLRYFDEKIKPGAFANSINKNDIRALFNHNPNFILGRNKAKTLELFEDSEGLRFSITPPDTQTARDLVTSVERGDVTEMSFGFDTIEDEWEHKRTDEKSLRTLIKVKLYDISPATYGAYADTKVAFRTTQDIWDEELNHIKEEEVVGIKNRMDNTEYYKRYVDNLEGGI